MSRWGLAKHNCTETLKISSSRRWHIRIGCNNDEVLRTNGMNEAEISTETSGDVVFFALPLLPPPPEQPILKSGCDFCVRPMITSHFHQQLRKTSIARPRHGDAGCGHAWSHPGLSTGRSMLKVDLEQTPGLPRGHAKRNGRIYLNCHQRESINLTAKPPLVIMGYTSSVSLCQGNLYLMSKTSPS